MFRARPGLEKKLKSEGTNLPKASGSSDGGAVDISTSSADGISAAAAAAGGGQSEKPSDAVTLVFRVGCIVKKIFLCAKFGCVPVDEVEYVSDQVVDRMRAWHRKVKIGEVLRQLPVELTAFRKELGQLHPTTKMMWE